MRSDLSVSIIICTCNRAASLQPTLEGLGKVKIPAGWQVEVILVDNASTDDTGKVARSVTLLNMTLRYLYEGRKGKSNALNAAMAKARGEFLLFTDDDVSVPEDWVEKMVSPLLRGQTDAVVGKVVLAQNLIKPWLTAWHQVFLAVVDRQFHGQVGLIGANMGFRRSVLERVPAFDTELGPGSPGLLNEESLFGLQLVEAGFKIGYVENATVTHQPAADRLKRRQWLAAAGKYGRTQAYIAYHWEHKDIGNPRLKWFWHWVKLHLRRIIQPPADLDSEGCPAWEMSYVLDMEMGRHFCVERRRPRNYSRKGLTKCCS
ncbi:MAG: glycosyltransferase family 2 protein [Verrucomicrobia bacterium]|nr:glycosyltransferase family 2 protein [Verrucomicrobiota bacterium]